MISEKLRVVTWKMWSKSFFKVIFYSVITGVLEVRLIDKTQASDSTKTEFYWMRVCILMALILKVTVSSLFGLTHTLTIMFGSPSTRVFSSVPTIEFSWVLFIWPHQCRTRLLHYLWISVMCSVLSLGPLLASEMRPFESIWVLKYYLLFIITRGYLLRAFGVP